MTLRKDLLEGIERFLALLPAQTRQRGRSYHASGNVLEFECVEPDHLYAAVVRGGEDYEVGLEFSESEGGRGRGRISIHYPGEAARP